MNTHFNIPAIASLHSLEINSRVVFLRGRKRNRKIHAIGSDRFPLWIRALKAATEISRRSTTASVTSIEPLVRALRLSFTKKTGNGFYLRAESFFNVASHVDGLGASQSYGGRSLHDQSHGESFLSLVQNRFNRSGFYIIDEPEAALSPQRQLSFLVLLHDLEAHNDNIQLLIATHSPILLAYPGAQIFSFDGREVHQISYRESPSFQLMSRFVASHERYMKALFSEPNEG